MSALLVVYRELLRTYYGQLKEQKEAPYFLYRYVYRPLSFPVSAVAIRLGASADAMTALNLVVLILAIVALAWGSSSAVLLGAWLYFVYFVMDFADGNVARYHGTSSYFGKLIDGMVDTVSFLVFAAAGWGCARLGTSGLGVEAAAFLGAATTISALLRQNYQWRMSALKAEVRHLEVSAPRAQAAPMRRAAWLFNNVVCSAPLCLLAAAHLDLVPVFLLAFFVLYAIGGNCEILIGVLKNRATLRARREY
jgi:phosphatidylglycerophosphate synthase